MSNTSPLRETTSPARDDLLAPANTAVSDEPAHALRFRAEGFVCHELLDGGELLYVPAFFDRATADALFAELRDGIPWEHVRIRGVPQKLATYWIGSVPYAYSRQVRPAAPWLSAPPAFAPPPWPDAPPGARIGAALSAWALACPRPLVVFLDEIDALRDAVLLSVLRQLRDGYDNRPGAFPASLALVGLRDVRDYKVASGGSDRLNTSSPFNIKARSLSMREFTAVEVAELLAQHTLETGQSFAPAALARCFELTQGQPWLVNALAAALTQELVTDRTQSITRDDVDRAKDLLIARQDTHLDSLTERLREARVRAVIEPMIQGELLATLAPDDLRFSIDLGLVRRDEDGTVAIANPIYREIIVRSLTDTIRASIPKFAPTWLRPDGTLDRERLRDAFVAFWTQHGEALLGSSPYNEAAAHLVLMAFLSRVVNGGGRIDRELAIGSKRLDLCLEFHGERLAIEVKTWRDSDKAKDPVDAGLAQLDEYLGRLGLAAGWLVRFDQRSAAPPLPDRISVEEVTSPRGLAVTVIGL